MNYYDIITDLKFFYCGQASYKNSHLLNNQLNATSFIACPKRKKMQ